MLRTAISSKSYDVTITIAGEQTKMEFRSLTLMERLALMEKVAIVTVSHADLEKLTDNLEQLIISIDGYDEKPSEIIRKLEHKQDLDDLLVAIYKWCHLPEQESKNLDSSPVPSSPGPAEENAEKIVGAENEPASTKPTDSAQAAQSS